MRPLVLEHNSSTESTSTLSDEEYTPQTLAVTSNQVAAGRNRSTPLQIVRVLKNESRSHHKTFLVRSTNT